MGKTEYMEIKNCDTLTSVEVGQQLWMIPRGNARYYSGNQPYVEGIVTRVGKKYFYVKRTTSSYEMQFTIDGANYKDDENASYVLFPSLEALQEHLNWIRKRDAIRKSLMDYSIKPMSKTTTDMVYDLLVKDGLIRE